jgi:hypothetical protein
MWAMIGGFIGLAIGAMIDYSENCSSIQHALSRACSEDSLKHSYNAVAAAAIGTLIGFGLDYLRARNERRR